MWSLTEVKFLLTVGHLLRICTVLHAYIYKISYWKKRKKCIDLKINSIEFIMLLKFFEAKNNVAVNVWKVR